jgi:hypothetical protein
VQISHDTAFLIAPPDSPGALLRRSFLKLLQEEGFGIEEGDALKEGSTPVLKGRLLEFQTGLRTWPARTKSEIQVELSCERSGTVVWKKTVQGQMERSSMSSVEGAVERVTSEAIELFLANARDLIESPEFRSAALGANGQPGAVAPAPANPTTMGCAKDTDCKGDRVCEEGRCAEPTRKPH